MNIKPLAEWPPKSTRGTEWLATRHHSAKVAGEWRENHPFLFVIFVPFCGSFLNFERTSLVPTGNP